MRVVVTGAAGFLGRQLAATLLQRGMFAGRPITRLVLVDRVGQVGTLTPGAHVEVLRGDLTDHLDGVFAQPVDVVFHLAAAVSAECESDFDLGMRVNVDATRALVDAARTQSAAGGPVPRLVFTSSLAVYGSTPAVPLPPLVSESTLPQPQSSYGAQKLICEQLISDCTRRGDLDGRIARLMTVTVRPGAPNAAASGFASSIIREPLAGLPATCPVRPDLHLAISSPRRTVQSILRFAEAERGTGPGQLNGPAPVNLPALTVSVADMLTTLRHIAGHAADLVTITPDPAVEAIVTSWPHAFDNQRATALGLQADPDFLTVVQDHLADQQAAGVLHV
ncbi:D-erythronate dehydrogenase [Streptomyces sp. NPDC008141]|uniref:D-erythronate dehydrogenase n=1 Tax=Streptomyces sp. NPDC008141 TaxID=3364815 RepID=UPI0036EBA236